MNAVVKFVSRRKRDSQSRTVAWVQSCTDRLIGELARMGCTDDDSRVAELVKAGLTKRRARRWLVSGVPDTTRYSVFQMLAGHLGVDWVWLATGQGHRLESDNELQRAGRVLEVRNPFLHASLLKRWRAGKIDARQALTQAKAWVDRQGLDLRDQASYEPAEAQS